MPTQLNEGFDGGVAAFNSQEFYNSEVFAGDTPPYMTDGPYLVPASTDMKAWTVVGLVGNEPGGAIAKATYIGAELADVGGAPAAVVGTFAGVGEAAATITIGTRVYTLRAALAAVDDVLIGATAAATAANLAGVINGTAGFAGQTPHDDVYATVTGAAVTVRANTSGVAGNSIASTETSAANFSWAAVTLLGGTDDAGGGVNPIGILTTDVLTGVGVVTTISIARSGCFDMDRLIWDTSFNTDAKKKDAFEGAPTPTTIKIVKRNFSPMYP